MIQEGYTHLTGNTGYLLLKVPQEILSEIKISVDEIQNDFTKAIPYNHELAGQLDKEYLTKLTHKATQYIRWAVEQYVDKNPKYYEYKVTRLYDETKSVLMYDGNAWVNFQEKYEYNPMHAHSGVFSYVIWYQIPFYKEDEIKYGAGKGKRPNTNDNGDFSFVYYNGENLVSDSLGIDKKKEGYIAVFPSDLQHQVFPFYTSDDYRITVSGNIHLHA
jgi:hypothetical protein